MSAGSLRRRISRFLSAESSAKLFVIVTVTIFSAEFLIMWVLFRERLLTEIWDVIVDPALLVVISFPILYQFFLAPLRRVLAEKNQIEEDLARTNDRLELRVAERTRELETLNQQLQKEIQERKLLQDELEIRVNQRTQELLDEIKERTLIERELETINTTLVATTNAEREQRMVAEGLVDVAIALNSSLGREDVLNRILDQTQRVLPDTAISLLLRDDSRFYHAGWRGIEELGLPMDWVGKELNILDSPVLSQVAFDTRPILIADTSQYAAWKDFRGLEGLRSYAAVPLTIDGKVIGCLQIISDMPGKFDERTLQVLNGFAAHAGLAIQNARLIENLQRSLNQEREVRQELVRTAQLAAMGRTIASVAHELNNPIQTIKNCIYLVRNNLSEAPTENDNREMLDLISNEIHRISALVSQLREVFRPNLNQTYVQVKLHNLIQEVQTTMIPQFRGSKVTLKVTDPPDPYLVFGVPDQLRQVFINLFQNSIEAMQAGGKLEVSYQTSPDHKAMVAVCVADNGPGIQEENLNQIFEPFFSTKSKGMGLGLPIVYQIVQRHHGQIQVNSTPGQGCTFLIWLPIHTNSDGEN